VRRARPRDLPFVPASPLARLRVAGRVGEGQGPQGLDARRSVPRVRRAARELRTSPWLSDGTPVPENEATAAAAAVRAALAAATAAAAAAGEGAPPDGPSPLAATSGSTGGGSACGSGGGGSSGAHAEERSALLGRSVLVDVSHAATSAQVIDVIDVIDVSHAATSAQVRPRAGWLPSCRGAGCVCSSWQLLPGSGQVLAAS
jgi:hypothetical protein